MVKSCCALGCTEHAVKGSGISFHCFPKDENLRKKWIIATRRQNFNPGANIVICSKHFLKEDYERHFGLLKLKKDVIPTVFNFTSDLTKRLPKKRTRGLKRDRSPSPTSIESEPAVPATSCSSSSVTAIDSNTQGSSENLVTEYPVKVFMKCERSPSPPLIKLEPAVPVTSCSDSSVTAIDSIAQGSSRNLVTEYPEKIFVKHERSPSPTSIVSEPAVPAASGSSSSVTAIAPTTQDSSESLITEYPVKICLKRERSPSPTPIVSNPAVSATSCSNSSVPSIDSITQGSNENLETKYPVEIFMKCERSPSPPLIKSEPAEPATSCSDSPETAIDSTTQGSNEISLNQYPPRIRNKRIPMFFGDYKYEELQTFGEQNLWRVANDQINKYRKTIQCLRSRERRLFDKVQKLEKVIDDLKEIQKDCNNCSYKARRTKAGTILLGNHYRT